ncbi:tRNA synthetases class I (M)-domain-containing protein [Crucibulum laeve]|uniref:Probable methionine--tRNA ligase, mitochondrial n=1 Tax=Crucibulum laeve TaxID=68775 RepID=A0A5C3LV24_9AGAR|nr:tRNA synthetases class I (M)-domain-containing protein [Crucibulum laeve]
MLLRHLPTRLTRFQRTRQPLAWRTLSTNGGSNEKSWYVTTPIFYPNAVPHIGHLYSLVVADILARFQRLLKPSRAVIFLAGTDEHGLKIQKAAKARGVAEKEFCNEISAQFRILAEKAQVSNTVFMRTTSDVHRNTVTDVWRRLDALGLIYKGSYAGWYSITDECFYTDAQVAPAPSSSTAPSNLSTPTPMVSIETGAAVEWSKEENYMFRLSSFRESLLAHYKSSPGAIVPRQHYSHIVSILENSPLEDISVSRPRSRLSWGVSVPGDPEHTVYVWFDALLVYLSGVGYPWKGGMTEGRERGWPVNVQVIGKDILRFHAIYLPAFLQALELPLQQQLLAHAHWTVEQKKMSKSLGNVADPFDAMEQYGVDIVRFYLAKVGGRWKDDVDWSESQLTKHSKELQSLLGNYFMRVTSKRLLATLSSAAPVSLADIAADSDSPNATLLTAARTLSSGVQTSFERLELSEALEKIIELLRLANKVLTDIAPWAPNTAPDTVAACYTTAMETLRVAGICLQPFTPLVAGKLLDALDVNEQNRTWECAAEAKEAGQVKGVRLF